MVTETDVRSSLTELPDTLKKAYEEIYDRILNQKKSAPRLALDALRWVKFSYEPLSSKDLLDAVNSRVSKSRQYTQDAPVSANTVLKICQKFLVFDQSVDTFRFAHLTVDEYLTTKLTEVESHILIAQTCLSLLCSPDYHQNYDQTVRTAEGNYARRNILLYSAIFWPWNSAHCGPLSHSGYALTTFWGKIVARYWMWLSYFRSVV
jgi:hypothetical protein